MKRLKKYKQLIFMGLAFGGLSMIWTPIVVGYYTTHPSGQTPDAQQHDLAKRFVADNNMVCVDGTEYFFNAKTPLFTPHYVDSQIIRCQGTGNITTENVRR